MASWSEALKNCKPFKVTANLPKEQTPYEKLFGAKPQEMDVHKPTGAHRFKFVRLHEKAARKLAAQTHKKLKEHGMIGTVHIRQADPKWNTDDDKATKDVHVLVHSGLEKALKR